MTGAPLASLAQGLVFMLAIELLGASQYLVALWLSGRLSSRLVVAAVLVKPYHLILAWMRLVALWREFRQRESTWNG
jgi:hypothetical protein